MKTLRFTKPELSLVDLFGILFVLLSVGGVLLPIFYYHTNPIVFLGTLLGFLVFLYFTLRALVNVRYIYIDSDTVQIRYRLGLKKNTQYSISKCTAFFPFTFQFRNRYSHGWQYGVTLFFENDFKLTLRSMWYGDDIKKVIEILKNHTIKNLNTKPGYDITSYMDNNFRFSTVDVVALEDMTGK